MVPVDSTLKNVRPESFLTWDEAAGDTVPHTHVEPSSACMQSSLTDSMCEDSGEKKPNWGRLLHSRTYGRAQPLKERVQDNFIHSCADDQGH